jgi:hypothetical protein
MKKILLIAICVITIQLTTVAQATRITVESEKALNHDFNKYKTFDFASMVDNDLEAGFYFVNDIVLRNEIREVLGEALMSRGYSLKDSNPDLVINFRVFDQETTLKGFEGYGRTYWGNEKVRQLSDTASYNVKPGTLLISFADKKTSRIVFQGFASGLIEGNKFIKDEVKIREAVRMILEEYDETASEYTRK